MRSSAGDSLPRTTLGKPLDGCDVNDDHDSLEDAQPPMESAFLHAAGLQITRLEPNRVEGFIDAGPDHHTPWGIVHGGLYTTAVESAASLGASLAVQAHGHFAVGVNNQTDFLRPHVSGRLTVTATPIQQGRMLQLWLVELTNEQGKLVARGQLRLANQPLTRPSP
jgi:uncharacterized protein (TIGR00369 family)